MDTAVTHKDYSATPLWKKLGIKEGHRVAFVNEPEGFAIDLPRGVQILQRASAPLDVMVFFSESRRHLLRRLKPLLQFLDPAGGFWIAYPKKASGVATDLTFDFVQQAGLEAGVVDNKSCAIDDVWTALRFVYRLDDRPRIPRVRTTA